MTWGALDLPGTNNPGDGVKAELSVSFWADADTGAATFLVNDVVPGVVLSYASIADLHAALAEYLSSTPDPETGS